MERGAGIRRTVRVRPRKAMLRAAAAGLAAATAVLGAGVSATGAAAEPNWAGSAGSSGPGSSGPVVPPGGSNPTGSIPTGPVPTTWLCNPALTDDPCDLPTDTTDLRTGETTPDGSVPESDKPVDCFYVYPTVTDEAAFNGGDAKWPEIRSIASFQAARFSSTCRVFAPVYDQVTLWGLAPGITVDHGLLTRAYDAVLSAWKDYLAHDNDGRGVILIGHSQGSMMLRKLIREQIDPDPQLRDRLVGAFLIGGNVTTARGSTTGGDFRSIPVCTEQGQDGCVVAYSTVEGDPVLNVFGNSSLDPLSFGMELPMGPQYQVACTDPAELAGDRAPVGLTIPSTPYAPGMISLLMQYTAFPQPLPTSASTWTTSRRRAVGQCVQKNGYDLYQFHFTDPGEPLLNEIPFMGTHLVDVNLGLLRLVDIARQQTRTWLAGH